MNVTTQKHRILRLAEEEYSGIDIGPTNGRRALPRMFPSDSGPGLIVAGGAIREWRILGVAESEGRLYAYGPIMEARDFIELPALLERRDGLAGLRDLALALKTLEESRRLPARLYPQGILLSEGGDLLFLPDAIMEKALSVSPFEKRLASHEVFNHPDLSGPAGASFSLGCLAYGMVTGLLPWDGTGEEELHTAMRSKPPLPPRLKKPGVRDGVSDFIMRALTDPEKPDFGTWKEALSLWADGGTETVLGEEDLDRLRREAGKAEAEIEGAAGRRRYWERNRIKLMVAACLAIVAGSVAWSIASNLLKPRATKGYPPEEVVRTFYRSMNGFDHALMKDCVLKGAGEAYIAEAMNLFVVSRMRLSAEMNSGFVDAEDWTKRGRPEVPAGKTVYGIAGLTIEKGAGTAEAPEYIAGFEHWVPVPADPESKLPPRPRGRAVKERVTLERYKGDWVIVKIERISEKAL